MSKRRKTSSPEWLENYSGDPHEMAFGGDLGNVLKNVGATYVNTLSSQVGGMVGNPDLIPEVEMVGNRKQQEAWDSINKVTGTLSGVAGGAMTTLLGPALGLPPGTTQTIQKGVNAVVDETEQMALGGNTPKMYEAEDKEVIQHNGDLEVAMGGKEKELSESTSVLEGNTHEQGGIKATGGERVFSDRLDYEKGVTFAKKAEEIGAKLAKHEKVFKEKTSSHLDRRTAGLMIERHKKDLDRLFEQQEQLKTTGWQDLKKYGGMLKEYGLGGVLPIDDATFEAEAFKREMSPRAFTQHLGRLRKVFEPQIMAYGGIPDKPWQFLQPDITDIQVPGNKLTSTLDYNSYAYPNDPVVGGGAESYFPDSRMPGDNTRLTNNPQLQGELRQPVSFKDMTMETRSPNTGNSFNPNKQLPSREPSPVNFPVDSTEFGNTYNPSANPTVDPNKFSLALPELGSASGVASSLLEYAPTIYNIGQGAFGKKDYYDREDNLQNAQALREIEASKRYNIDPILESNSRGEAGLREEARSVSRDSGTYLATALAANAQKRGADAQAYDQRENFMSQANMNAANARNQIGEQERAEDRNVQLNQLQTDAKKRDFLAQGLTGVSDISQRNQLDRAQQENNTIMLRSIAEAAPAFKQHYMDAILRGTSLGNNPEVNQMRIAVSSLAKNGMTAEEISQQLATQGIKLSVDEIKALQ